MTNEEFQKIVLEELKGIKKDVGGLKEGQQNLEAGQQQLTEKVGVLEVGQRNLEKGQRELGEKVSTLEKTVNAIHEQTANLTEFRGETKEKLDILIDENNIMKEISGRHEVDIKRLKRIII